MGERQFNHKEALAQAYAALYTLRQEGLAKPTIFDIARRSGVQRTTMYTKHPDWVMFLKVVREGLPLKDLNLAGIEVEEKADWVRRADRVDERVVKVEQNLESAKALGESVYASLIAQLHKYVVLSRQAQSQHNKVSELLKVNAEIKHENQRLREQNAELKISAVLPVTVRPLFRKEVVVVCNCNLGQSTVDVDFDEPLYDAVNKLDDYFAASHQAQVPSGVYVMTGNFASGKSRWISTHSPPQPGVSLYIDGINHTARGRKLLLKRIRKLNPQCMVVCVRVMLPVEDCLTRNKNPDRDRTGRIVPDEIIKRVETEFEEISIDEGFDQIIVV